MIQAPRYVARFQCIADRCEDTCCAGMHVLLSNDERQRLKPVLAARPELSEAFENTLVEVKPALLGYSLELAKDENDACRLLSSGLCSLQKALGPDALPDTCARFPREVHVRNDGVEIYGTLACPEMARLCLLSEDSLQKTPLPPEEAMRQWPAPKKEHAAATQWRHAACDIFKEVGKSSAEAWRQALIFFHLWDDASSVQVESGLDTVLSVLVGLRARENRRYNAFNEAVMLTYQLAALEEDPRIGMVSGTALAQRLGHLYLNRKNAFQMSVGARIEPMLSRYLQNRFSQLTFSIERPSQEPVFDALLQAACISFLLVGHPVLDGLSASAPEAQNLIDRSVVQTVQWFSKYVERDHDLWDEVRQHLKNRLGPDEWHKHSNALWALL